MAPVYSGSENQVDRPHRRPHRRLGNGSGSASGDGYGYGYGYGRLASPGPSGTAPGRVSPCSARASNLLCGLIGAPDR